MGDNEKKTRTSLELAEDRTRLAELRNDYAETRTHQAAQRTYAAWVRTGFTLASAGWGFGKLLQDEAQAGNFALGLGGLLIVLGILCFFYGWYGFRTVFNFLKKTTLSTEAEKYPFEIDMILMTTVTVALTLIFVIGFALLLL